MTVSFKGAEYLVAAGLAFTFLPVTSLAIPIIAVGGSLYLTKITAEALYKATAKGDSEDLVAGIKFAGTAASAICCYIVDTTAAVIKSFAFACALMVTVIGVGTGSIKLNK